jgi:hypothetical protein
MTWLSRDARTRETILSEYTRFTGAPRQYRPPTRGYLAHVAKVLDRAFYNGLLVAVLELDAALPEMGSVEGGTVAPPATTPEESRVLRVRPARTWVSIELLDDAGDPVRDIAFELELPDGSKRSGRLDERGRARFDGIKPGECKLSFPDIDASEWSAA